jgi:hypothetical protein
MSVSAKSHFFEFKISLGVLKGIAYRESRFQEDGESDVEPDSDSWDVGGTLHSSM